MKNAILSLVIVCVIGLGGNSHATLTNNMVAFYHFDGDMNDSTPGSSDIGTLSGYAEVNQDDVQAGTHSFESQNGGESNGGYSFGMLPEGSAINGSNNWTIAFWVNSKASQLWRNAFSFDGESSIRMEDGNGSWRFYASGYGDIAGHPFTKTLNKWTFFALTADGSTLRVFQGFEDGNMSLQYSKTIDGGESLAGGSTMVLGGRLSNPSAATRLLDCYLDEVGIWTRALSTNEVNALFDVGKAGYNIVPEPVLMDSMSALYHFDGNMNDSTPGSSDVGTLSGNADVNQDDVQVGTHSFESQNGGVTNAAGDWSFGTLPEGSAINGCNYWTIAFWVNSKDNTDWNNAFSFDGSSSLRLEDGVPGWRFYASGYGDLPANDFTKPLNKWTFFALTADGSTLKVYYGLEDSTLSMAYSETIDAGESLAGGNTMVVGARTSTGGRLLNCYLDEIGIWVRPLSADEVGEVFDLGKAGKNIAPPLPAGTVIIIK